MHPEAARRGCLLYVALAFLGLNVPPVARPSGLRAAHVNTWHGIGLIEHGLARQARDLSLTRYRDRWGASVFVTGMEHSIACGECRAGTRRAGTRPRKMDQRPLGASDVTAAQSSRLHLAFRVGAAGAETLVNLAWSNPKIPRERHGPAHQCPDSGKGRRRPFAARSLPAHPERPGQR
jgi:hypothetical protein